MKKLAGLAGIGLLCLALGFYIMPFGYDILLSCLIDLGGGDYWTGTLYAYMLSIGLIVAGLALTRPGILRYLIDPRVAVGLLILLGAGYYIIFAGGAP